MPRAIYIFISALINVLICFINLIFALILYVHMINGEHSDNFSKKVYLEKF